MGISDITYTLSNINAGLASGLTYFNQRESGMDSASAMMNFGINLSSGIMRNDYANNMYNRTGSTLGYTINNLYGYGSAESNIYGSSALSGASMFMSPMNWGYGSMGIGGFGGGYSSCYNNFGNFGSFGGFGGFGGFSGFSGISSCVNPYFGSSMFGGCGLWC